MSAQPQFFSKTWANLNWTDWFPLNAPASALQQTPTPGGLYRIRPCGHAELAYIGQTRRNLLTRLRELSGPTYGDVMPFNDPHTAAQSLWVLRVEEGMEFECSVAPVSVGDQGRHAIENMLLWTHRLEFGESPLCNFGRFHPRYYRSTNRVRGQRGGKLPPGQTNPASGPSARPLELQGEPIDANWMGLFWSDLSALHTYDLLLAPECDGLYKILDESTHELLYVGETQDLRSRLRSHAARKWGDFQPLVSFHALPDDVLVHQRHELESDLLGAYYETFRRPPVFQYLGH